MSKYECVNDDFKIMGCVKKLYVYSDAYIYENFPRNKKHLKILYFNECKSLFDNVSLANNTSGNVRKKYQVNILCNISFLNFLLTYFYDLGIVEKRRFSSAIRLLSEILLMVKEWE